MMKMPPDRLSNDVSMFFPKVNLCWFILLLPPDLACALIVSY